MPFIALDNVSDPGASIGAEQLGWLEGDLKQLSKDQRFLFSANRGLNHITVYDYPSNTIRLRAPMPDIQEFVPSLSPMADPRLGFHHGALVS